MTLRRALLVLALAVVAVIVWRLTARHVPGGPPPSRMIGFWLSNDPRYSDRYMEIHPDTMTFGTGGVASRTYRILGCERIARSEGKTLFILHIADASGARYNRPMYLDDSQRLWFKNQPNVVWTRAP